MLLETHRFNCPTCFKTFGRKEHLVRHELIHSRKKLNECVLCSKNFTRKDHLTKHLQKHKILHENPDGLICYPCG